MYKVVSVIFPISILIYAGLLQNQEKQKFNINIFLIRKFNFNCIIISIFAKLIPGTSYVQSL